MSIRDSKSQAAARRKPPAQIITAGDRWDARFLDLAEFFAGWSKDPSTKVGAVIVDRERRLISQGFNGFPQGVDDAAERYADRDAKLPRMVHAELNAIIFARGPLAGCTLYCWPLLPCSTCAGAIIQAGIRRVVAPPAPERWRISCALAVEMLGEAGILVDIAPAP